MIKLRAPFRTVSLITLLLISLQGAVFAQQPDAVYNNNIRSIRFHPYGNPFALPVYNLNGADQLELNFDDMEGNMKSYYYTFQICDYDWQPVDMSTMNYIRGFTQQRITTYRYSSIALTRYTHYQALLPERGTTLTLSGNYLLKVYLDGDTSKLVFTRRLFVLDQKASINAQSVQPFSPDQARSSQKVKLSANVQGLNSFSAAQQVKVVILQNNRWDFAQRDIAPTFVRGNTLDYSAENLAIFPGGKEWRWLDLRSFKLQSDRVDHADYNKSSTDIYVQTDGDRNNQRYVYYKDLNGFYSAETYETINPYWQADYATVHFSFAPPDGKPYTDRDLYITGQLTDYQYNDKTKLVFNEAKGLYEVSLFLKQGYYSYGYVAIDKNDPEKRYDMEGNYWETENNYTILMYYRSFTDRTDQLIGFTSFNTRTDRPGISF